MKKRDLKACAELGLRVHDIVRTNELKDEQKDEALTRAVELAPKLQEELGQTWLGEGFTNNEARGREVHHVIAQHARRVETLR